jgi:hypothetical protein
MTLDYATEVARPSAIVVQKPKVDAMTTWLYALALLNMAVGLVVLLGTLPSLAVLAILSIDIATMLHPRHRSR